MKFSTREDIEVPIADTFARVSDFAAFERRALRHGVQVTRGDDGPVKPGSQWQVAFKFRGRNRALDATLSTLDDPNFYQVLGASDGMTFTTEVELVALSPNRTRIIVGLDLRAKSMTSRLILQSMKLAKAKLSKRFRARVLEFSEETEDAYRKGQ
ncbi:SRPBCC family protein [Yoonia sp. I 8.24]|uniref:SRPBCC family protein n=1 Tax=Yoonia sp. I 8.24 TaxID=1537229 RepID=UPI001EDF1702|nr:SRPBCC family protein [Yoonia sp. I 8.24]MCG3266951.1 SRPBCC family protein [Yoonia sp. I 8.24]